MNHLVLWIAAAEDALTLLWLHSKNRNRLSALASQADAILRTDPVNTGKNVFDTVYELVIENLGIEYEVIAEDRHVRVLNVWDASAGRPGPSGN